MAVAANKGIELNKGLTIEGRRFAGPAFQKREIGLQQQPVKGGCYEHGLQRRLGGGQETI